MPELNEKQKKFISEYLVDLNARQAAIRAGYSQSTATAQASRLLANVNIYKAIQEARESDSNKLQFNRDRWLEELKLCALSDIKQYIDINPENGTIRVKNLDEMKEGSTRAIKKIKSKKTTRYSDDGDQLEDECVEIELWDKQKALETIGKHLGFFDLKRLAETNLNPSEDPLINAMVDSAESDWASEDD